MQADPALFALMHQLITAKLNLVAGAAAPEAVGTAIDAADAAIGARSVTCTPACNVTGAGYVRVPPVSTLIAILDGFNNGCVDDALTPLVNECQGIPLHCTPEEERQRMLDACYAVKPACNSEALDDAGKTACCLAP